jgi:hypothetical protein
MEPETETDVDTTPPLNDVFVRAGHLRNECNEERESYATAAAQLYTTGERLAIVGSVGTLASIMALVFNWGNKQPLEWYGVWVLFLFFFRKIELVAQRNLAAADKHRKAAEKFRAIEDEADALDRVVHKTMTVQDGVRKLSRMIERRRAVRAVAPIVPGSRFDDRE